MNALIRILIIDDSIVFREALARGLSHEPSFDILPTASSAAHALDIINQYQPHIIVSDIEMPGMNGLDFLQQYSKRLNTPTIVLSSRDDLKGITLKSGASAFLSKPKVTQQDGVKHFILELMKTIVHVYHLNQVPSPTSPDASKHQVKVIAIGASTGGTEAITELLLKLPRNMPPIVIAQHIPEQFSLMFAKRLNDMVGLTVKEASRLEPLLPNHVYIAPGNAHMFVKKIQDKLMIQCRDGEKINGHRPSVDILFQSVTQAVNNKAIGVILTGMGKDGAYGLLQMRQIGCYTIGQDEQTSVVYGMPKVAYDIGAVEKQLPLHRIAHEILVHI